MCVLELSASSCAVQNQDHEYVCGERQRAEKKIIEHIVRLFDRVCINSLSSESASVLA